jgi:SAM-dependent methyltransferase
MNSLKEQYDQIAPAFSESRKKYLWPELIAYLTRLKAGQRVLDMGAGSGRLYKNLPTNIEYIGLDISLEMLKEAKKNNPGATFFEADVLDTKSLNNLGLFDHIFIIALAHHLDQHELTNLFLSIKSKLKPNGFAILSCWRLLNRKYFFAHIRQIFTKIKRTNLRYIEIPFSISDGRKTIKSIKRTCYAYDIFKLRYLAQRAGLKVITHSLSKANIWLEFSLPVDGI